MSATATPDASITSPFALMFPAVAEVIVARAAALSLPTRRCSPLSTFRPVSKSAKFVSLDDDDDDELIDDA